MKSFAACPLAVGAVLLVGLLAALEILNASKAGRKPAWKSEHAASEKERPTAKGEHPTSDTAAAAATGSAVGSVVAAGINGRSTSASDGAAPAVITPANDWAAASTISPDVLRFSPLNVLSPPGLGSAWPATANPWSEAMLSASPENDLTSFAVLDPFAAGAGWGLVDLSTGVPGLNVGLDARIAIDHLVPIGTQYAGRETTTIAGVGSYRAGSYTINAVGDSSVSDWSLNDIAYLAGPAAVNGERPFVNIGATDIPPPTFRIGASARQIDTAPATATVGGKAAPLIVSSPSLSNGPSLSNSTALISGNALPAQPTTGGTQPQAQANGLPAGGSLYLSNFGVTSLLKVPASGVPSNFTNSTNVNNPQGLSFSLSGTLYVANFGSNSIEKFDITGRDLGTFPTTGLHGPAGMVFDSSGNLYVANQTTTATILRYPPGGGSPFLYSTLPSGLLATAPTDLAFDSLGNLYVTDYNNAVIYKIPPGGGTPIALATGGNLNQPFGLAIRGSTLYVANGGNNRIEEFSLTGTPGTDLGLFGMAGNGPTGIVFDSAGDLFVANSFDSTIGEFGPTGGTMSIFATGNFANGLTSPEYLAFIPEPGSPWMLLAGAGALAVFRRRRSSARSTH